MKVECTVDDRNFNIDAMLEDMGVDKQNSLLAFAADTAYKMMEPYVPRSNGGVKLLTGKYGTKAPLFVPGGQLRENVDIYEGEEGYIIEYNQPYARYQYYGQRADGTHEVYHWTTPGTGPFWDLVMITNQGDEFEETLEKYIEEKLK